MDSLASARMNFPAPTETFELKGKGTIYFTTNSGKIMRDDLNKIVGKVVTLGGRPFKVRGVESYALMELSASSNIGLLGEYADTDDYPTFG